MDEPASVKILKYLRDNPIKRASGEIAAGIAEEPGYVDRALAKLVEKNIISKEQGFYYYQATPQAEDFSTKLFKLYDKVIAEPKKQLLVRGLLSQTAAPYFFHANTLLDLLAEEGFAEQEIRDFLEKEIGNGHIKKVKIMIIATGSASIPWIIPSHYMPYLESAEPDEYQRIKEHYHDSKALVFEEDYIIGLYPPRLANPAREYLDREKEGLRNRISKNVFQLPSTWTAKFVVKQGDL